MIRNRDRAIPKLGCGVNQLIRMTRAAQEGEVARHIELGVVEIALRHARRWRQGLARFWIGRFGHREKSEAQNSKSEKSECEIRNHSSFGLRISSFHSN